MENKTTKKTFGQFITDGENVRTYLPFAMLAAIIIIIEIWSGGALLRGGSLSAMANTLFTSMLLALGALFVYGAGGMDFSVGSLYGVVIMEEFLILRNNYTAGGIILAIVVALATGAVVGFINGFIAVKFRLPAMISSFAMNNALRGVIQVACTDGEISAPEGFASLDNLTVKIIVMVIFIVFIFILFEKTKYGKELKLIGGNAEAARQAGIKIDKRRISGYILFSVLTAVIALISSPRTSLLRATTGATYMLNVLVGLLLGGVPITGGPRTKVYGALLGTITVTVLENGLLLCGVEDGIITIVKALIFLAMIWLNREKSSRGVVM